MFRSKTIDLEVFKWLIDIVITDEQNTIKEKYNYDIDGDLLGITIKMTGENFKKLVIIINTNDDEYDESIITHEAIHASNFILDSMGVRADFDNEEVLCYISEFIHRKITQFINES